MIRHMAHVVEQQPRDRVTWPVPPEVETQTRPTITRQGERALQARVQRLRHQLEVEFPDRLNESRGFGEIGGNDDYLQALEEQAVLASRLSRLQRLLDSATVVEREPARRDASVGTVVETQDLSSGAIHEHRLVGDYESRNAGAVSASSPVGRALIGRSPGDELEVQLPRGRVQQLRVLAVRAPA